MAKKKWTKEKLAVDHPYYFAMGPWWNKEECHRWSSWELFYEEFKNADLDMNQVFRWDLEPDEKVLHIVMGKQRKGYINKHTIDMSEATAEHYRQLGEYLEDHWGRLKQLWEPFK